MLVDLNHYYSKKIISLIIETSPISKYNHLLLEYPTENHILPNNYPPQYHIIYLPLLFLVPLHIFTYFLLNHQNALYLWKTLVWPHFVNCPTSSHKLGSRWWSISLSMLQLQCSPRVHRHGPLDTGDRWLPVRSGWSKHGGRRRNSSGGWWGWDSHSLAWRAHCEGCGRAHVHVHLRGKFESSKLLDLLLQPPVLLC